MAISLSSPWRVNAGDLAAGAAVASAHLAVWGMGTLWARRLWRARVVMAL